MKKVGYKGVLLLGSMINITVWLIIYGLSDFMSSDAALSWACGIILLYDTFALVGLIRWKKTIFRISVLFALMYVLYMHGQPILYLFGLTYDGTLLSNKFDNKDIIIGLFQTSVFLSLYVAAVACTKATIDKGTNNSLYDADNKMIKVGIGVTLISLPFEVMVNYSKLYFKNAYGYASLYQDISLNAIPSAYKILSYFFIPGCLYLLFGSKRESIVEKVSLVLMLFHSMIELLIGYRASAIVPVILVLYCFSTKTTAAGPVVVQKKTKRIIRWTSYISVLIVVFIFPIIRSLRNTDRITIEIIFKNFSVEGLKDIFRTVNDMGKSLQTVIYTQQLVPKTESFRYGVTYLVSLTEVIPNFFWSRHPAEVYGSLGKWLTKIVDRSFYDFGGALGFSCVAESYINFGYLGICFFPVLFGSVLETVENKASASHSNVDYASLSIVATYLLSYPRGEFGDLVRGFFWYALIPYIFYRYVRLGVKTNVLSNYSNEGQTG